MDSLDEGDDVSWLDHCEFFRTLAMACAQESSAAVRLSEFEESLCRQYSELHESCESRWLSIQAAHSQEMSELASSLFADGAPPDVLVEMEERKSRARRLFSQHVTMQNALRTEHRSKLTTMERELRHSYWSLVSAVVASPLPADPKPASRKARKSVASTRDTGAVSGDWDVVPAGGGSRSGFRSVAAAASSLARDPEAILRVSILRSHDSIWDRSMSSLLCHSTAQRLERCLYLAKSFASPFDQQHKESGALLFLPAAKDAVTKFEALVASQPDLYFWRRQALSVQEGEFSVVAHGNLAPHLAFVLSQGRGAASSSSSLAEVFAMLLCSSSMPATTVIVPAPEFVEALSSGAAAPDRAAEAVQRTNRDSAFATLQMFIDELGRVLARRRRKHRCSTSSGGPGRIPGETAADTGTTHKSGQPAHAGSHSNSPKPSLTTQVQLPPRVQFLVPVSWSLDECSRKMLPLST